MKLNKKLLLSVCVVLSVLFVIAGVTAALLINRSNSVKNSFKAGISDIEISEDITSEPGVKKDVKIKNTGTVDSYVRACVAISWVDADGNVYNSVPEADVDYTVETPDDFGWVIDGSVYYCKNAVKAGETSPVLFTSIAPVTENVPEGYTFSVEILGSSIQCLPVTEVESAWGVTVNNYGTLSK